MAAKTAGAARHKAARIMASGIKRQSAGYLAASSGSNISSARRSGGV